MTLWHWLTTSRYTRYLEQENAELKERNKRLETVLIPRLAQIQAQNQAVVAKETKPVSAPQAAAAVKVCGECEMPHTATRCPNCGSMKTQSSAAPQFKRFRGFSRVKEEIEGQVSEATNSN